MTTANQQKEMFYAAGKQATIKALGKFIAERNKDRFKLVESLRVQGKLESHWHEVEKHDADTERQEKILEELIKNA